MDECYDDYPCNNGFDTAGKVLSFLTSHIDGFTPLSQKTDDWQSLGTLQQFDQTEFLDHPSLLEKSGFMEHGYVYIPDSCMSSQCHIHLNLHCCGGQGETLPNYGGYNEWAANNKMIMLYPMVETAGLFGWGDCFDTFGYTGDDFATKDGI